MHEKFLITGGQGFVGSWVVRVLLQEGTEFVTLDQRPTNSIIFQVVDPERLGDIKRIFTSFSDTEGVQKVLEEQRITRVIHLAGYGVPPQKDGAKDEGKVRLKEARSLLEAIGELRDQIALTVYLGGTGGPEEETASRLSREKGIPSVGLRPETIYGVGMERGPLSGPTRAIKAAVLLRHFSIPFTGSQGFTYVEEAARLLLAVARSNTTEAVSLRLRSEESSVEDFIRGIEQAVPEAKGQITCEGEELQREVVLEEVEVEELLGETKITAAPLEEGIRRTADHFRTLAHEQRLHDRDLSENF